MTEYEKRLLRRVARFEFCNELAHRQTRQGRFDAAMVHYQAAVTSDGMPAYEPGDGGAGAAAIYAAVEEPEGPSPRVAALRAVRARLKPSHQRVLDALLVDPRPRVAARIAGVGKNLVYTCLREVGEKVKG